MSQFVNNDAREGEYGDDASQYGIAAHFCIQGCLVCYSHSMVDGGLLVIS